MCQVNILILEISESKVRKREYLWRCFLVFVIILQIHSSFYIKALLRFPYTNIKFSRQCFGMPIWLGLENGLPSV